jgi:hypothetical protein
MESETTDEHRWTLMKNDKGKIKISYQAGIDEP